MDDLLSAADIERLAKASNIPLKDLFERACISHTTFYRWRSGKTKPSIDVYQRLREALNSPRAV